MSKQPQPRTRDAAKVKRQLSADEQAAAELAAKENITKAAAVAQVKRKQPKTETE